MKILHTADWHLGKRLESFNRHDEQVAVLDEICYIADREQVDAVIIAGDIFDSFNPPNESIDLFYKICKRLTNNGLRPVIAIAGNHDSPERIEAPDPLARECGIIFAGFPNTQVPLFSLSSGLEITQSEAGYIAIKLPQYDYPLHILLTPYANEERLKKYLGEKDREVALREFVSQQWQEKISRIPQNGVNILMAHLLFVRDNQTVIKEDEGEKPIFIGTASAFYPEDIPDGLQYVALGHLHRFHYVAKTRLPIVYSGSPLAYSFNEENQEKYVIIVEATPKSIAKIKEIPLSNARKLLKITAENTVDALEKLEAVPNALVQLTLKTKFYLDPSITQPLFEAHKGIVPPIIAQTEEDTEGVTVSRQLDFDNIENMFLQYFKFKKKEEPSEELMQIFKEVIAEEKN
jgi:DNA repair protein SbcD/Mre11